MQTGRERNFTASLSLLAGEPRCAFNDFLRLRKMTDVSRVQSRFREKERNNEYNNSFMEFLACLHVES